MTTSWVWLKKGVAVHADEQFLEGSLRKYLDGLASSSSTPGGGSAAALAGALGAALVSMVAGLTLSSPRFEDVHPQAKALLERSEALRLELQTLTQTDAQAYASVSRAMKMAKETEEEKQARTEQLQKAMKWATEVPMQVARGAEKVAQLAVEIAETGNVNAISDAGAAALLAEVAVKAAQLNVAINAGFLHDKAAGAAALAEVADLVAQTVEAAERALAATRARMG